MKRTLFTIILPSLVAGGLVLGSAIGNADDGRALSPPTGAAKKPTPPPAPQPPAPPRPPRAGGGFSVSVQDGKVQIGGIDQLIDEQLDTVLDSLMQGSNIPPAVRDKVTKRLEKVRAKVKQRVSNLDATELDDLGEELGKMGDELGKEMEDFGKEMEKFGKDFEIQLGKDLGKQLSRKWGKFSVHIDHDDGDNDDRDRDDDVPDLDDPDDLDDAVRDLGDLNLKPPQRAAIKQLRLDSEAKVAAARRDLARAEEQLERELEATGASDAEIARAIDAVAQQEAAIRKARILAWVNARRVLDDTQRKKVESAKGKTR